MDNLKQISNDGIVYLSIMHHDLGMVHYHKKEYEKSLKYFQESMVYLIEKYYRYTKNPETDKKFLEELAGQVLGAREKLLEILNILADEKFQKKDYYSAIDYYKKAISYDTNESKVYCNLGQCLRKVGAHNSALLFLKEALKLSPEDYDIYRLIGDVYIYDRNDPKNALTYYEKYSEYEKENALAYNMMGHLYERLDKYSNINIQEKYFKKAIELMPDCKCAIKNLSLVYQRLRKNEEAMELYKKMFELGPSMDDYFDYACQNIRMKNFEEGWKYYEYRFKKENGATPYPKIKQPKWKGQKLNNKTLLVEYEQGFGDSIHFFRYLPQLKDLADKIIFRVQDDLADLFKINANGMEIVKFSTPLENLQFHYHIPLMSLPHILNARIDNIPFTEGFLKVDKNKVQEYKKDYFNNDCLKIGISWQGAIVGNERRNIPLEAFYPLTKLKNVKVYAFQKGPGAEQLKDLPTDIEIIDLGSTFKDFNDTAAAMENVDLFISSDNCVPNLAGAIGKETFLLLNQDAEWRWFFDEEKTPWYDSFRLFKKQNEKDDWSTLIDRVIENLPQKTLL